MQPAARSRSGIEPLLTVQQVAEPLALSLTIYCRHIERALLIDDHEADALAGFSQAMAEWLSGELTALHSGKI